MVRTIYIMYSTKHEIDITKQISGVVALAQKWRRKHKEISELSFFNHELSQEPH